MQNSDSPVQIQVELPHDLYVQLLAKSQSSGKRLTDLIVQGIEYILRSPHIPSDITSDRLAQIELSLESRLKEYLELRLTQILEERNLSIGQVPENPDSAMPPPEATSLPIPTIRPLQIGDRVLILEPDSPYYMAKLLVVRTSLIRATVETETGEKTFLKRDLRFIEST